MKIFRFETSSKSAARLSTCFRTGIDYSGVSPLKFFVISSAVYTWVRNLCLSLVCGTSIWYILAYVPMLDSTATYLFNAIYGTRSTTSIQGQLYCEVNQIATCRTYIYMYDVYIIYSCAIVLRVLLVVTAGCSALRSLHAVIQRTRKSYRWNELYSRDFLRHYTMLMSDCMRCPVGDDLPSIYIHTYSCVNQDEYTLMLQLTNVYHVISISGDQLVTINVQCQAAWRHVVFIHRRHLYI